MSTKYANRMFAFGKKTVGNYYYPLRCNFIDLICGSRYKLKFYLARHVSTRSTLRP